MSLVAEEERWGRSRRKRIMVLQIQLLVLESWMLDASYWMLEVGSPVGAEANVYQLRR